jgi:signal peptidase I
MQELKNHKSKSYSKNQLMRFSRDIFSIVIFVTAIVGGAFLLNTFVFQSYNVFGASMKPTLDTNDRLIINKLPKTFLELQGQNYIPKRGQIIVFKSNMPSSLTNKNEHLVKRVVGLPGDRVVVRDGELTIYNSTNPRGFNLSDIINFSGKGPKSPTYGNIDTVVKKNEVFVAGDNRIGNNSLDSRNGLGNISVKSIEGPVYIRVYPFNEFKFFYINKR